MRYGSVLIAVLPIAVLVGGLTENANIRNLFPDASVTVAKPKVQEVSVQTGTNVIPPNSSMTSTAQNLSGSQSAIAGKSNKGQNVVGAATSGGSASHLTANTDNVSNSSSSSSPSGHSMKSSLPHIQQLSSSLFVSSSDFGINIAEWDSEMNASSTVPAIKTLGTSLQRYPNNDAWSWKLNRSRNGSDNYQSWDSSTSAFSMLQWGAELRATGNQGIFNINYGMNSSWNGGQSVADVKELTHYILNHHIPVRAMVVGSENYSGTTINLRSDKSAKEYATVAKQMAVAIHQIDPHMMVGVNITPGINGQMSSADELWNDTVLRIDAPYIQFVTLHPYPVDRNVSESGLLNTLMTDIPNVTATVRRQMLANAGKYAPHIQVWFTEFNLFNSPRPDTVRPVSGAAAMESLLLARALGIQQIDWWSLHGGAHALLPSGEVASAEIHRPTNNYGTFALVGDGQAPEIGLNSQYPAAAAMSKLMSLLHNGARLQVQRTNHLFVAKISKGNTTHWIVVNRSTAPQTVQLGSRAYKVSATNYAIISTSSHAVLRTAERSMGWSSSDYVTPGSLAAVASTTAPPAAPHISSVSSSTIHSNELLTLRGAGFGNTRGAGYVAFSNNGVNWGSPQNYYKLAIKKWTNTEIQFVTPSASVPHGSVNLKPGSSASVTVFAQGNEASNTLKLHVHSALPAHLSTSSITPGQVLTITGSGFGTSEGSGYVQFSNHDVNWGAPTNFYKLHIVSWKDNAVSFVVPTEHITAGAPASVQIMGSNGLTSTKVTGTLK